ncbi:head GIN domain-containing protein [Flectobacillus major]|uniref:head GIN domain-containing protein n=1 Tax=Flectobacillus major TaxID=103 RepID=UPI00041B147E|nr:head GIN domain-containing protein [Flectobacillus major]
MKKFVLSLLFSLVACIALNAQVINQKRNAGSFKGIHISSGIDLYIKQGTSESVVISAEEDKQSNIQVENDNGVLKIYVENSKWGWFKWNNKPVKAYVTVKDLNVLSATGGSDVYSEGKLDLIKLSVRATGGSDVRLDIDADELTCETTGGSDVYLTGNATVFKASSTGGSDLKASKLKTSFCSVSSTGGSDAYVWAEKEISISATGGSDVYYSGNARVVKKSATGGSDVHKQ